jgi:hypothetical protein
LLQIERAGKPFRPIASRDEQAGLTRAALTAPPALVFKWRPMFRGFGTTPSTTGERARKAATTARIFGLSVLCALALSCGSVSKNSGADAGAGGATAAGGATGGGGTTGSGGGTGTDGGTGAGGGSGLVVSGHIGTMGTAPAATGTLRIVNQGITFPGGPACGQSLCVNGGIGP